MSATLVVVPAWNEEASVASVVREVRATGLPVLVVDDGSDDDTAAAAEAAGARVLRLPVNLGVGAALRAGFRYAVDHGFDRVVQCDADGQHRPADIVRLLDAADGSGAHLVVGSRFAGNDSGMAVSGHRRLVMRMLAWSASQATRTRITDATSGFRVISQPLLGHFSRVFPAHYLGDTFEAMVCAGRRGYRVAEIPVSMRERTQGVSSASPAAAVRLIIRAGIVFVTRLHVTIPVVGSTPEPVRT